MFLPSPELTEFEAVVYVPGENPWGRETRLAL
jgi:hypothetical protein